MENQKQLLNAALESGEKILWSGAAEEFETLDAVYKKSIIRKAIINGLITLAILLFYIFFSVAKDSEINAVLIIVIAGIGALACYSGYSDVKRIKKTLYAFTDRGLYSVRDDAKCLEYGKISVAKLLKDAAGHTSLLLGMDGIKFKENKIRRSATSPAFRDDYGNVESFALYALPMSDGLEKIIRDNISLI